MQGSDKGCGFAISTDDMPKKIDEQLGEATEGKTDPTNRLTSKIQRKLCKFREEKKLQARLTLNYIYPTPFHHVYVVQLKFSYASY